MNRTMLQLNLRGCDEAIALYEKAFGTQLDCVYRSADGLRVEHAEMRAFGQCVAFSEQPDDVRVGNTMQFCFDCGEGHEDVIRHAYEVLRPGATEDYPLGPCNYSRLMFSLVDRFGVHWCMFI